MHNLTFSKSNFFENLIYNTGNVISITKSISNIDIFQTYFRGNNFFIDYFPTSSIIFLQNPGNVYIFENIFDLNKGYIGSSIYFSDRMGSPKINNSKAFLKNYILFYFNNLYMIIFKAEISTLLH